MSLQELMNKTIKAVVNKDNGISSIIKYYSFEFNTYTNTKAIVSYGDFSKLSSDEDILSDSAYFYCVELHKLPKKRDIITIDNIEWKVIDFIKLSDSLYDIYCQKELRHTAKVKRGR